MNRRQFSSAASSALALATMAAWSQAHALSLGDLTHKEASQGLKAALERGAMAAVALLGKPGGFLDNPKVRIPLPGFLADASKFLRAMGRGQQVDELEVAMNRAAELLTNAVKSMTVNDAKNILAGGDTSVTDFFAEKTRTPLAERFLPVVTRATEKVGLAEKYNRLAGKAAGMGLVRKDDAAIEPYVTRKSLDGLYAMIGEEERKIRQDPAGSGSAILRKVFGSMQ
jgi:hypothetical protein